MVPPVDKVAFSIFGIDIMWYAITMIVGILAGFYFAEREAKRRGEDVDEFTNVVFLAVIGGIIGARLYYVAFKWDYYSQNIKEILNFRQGGLAIYGALIGAILVGYFVAKKRGQDPIMLLDISAPSIALGQAIGRWGNFINQEAYGYQTDLPWAVIIDGVGHHPTFLYESIGDFLIFLFLTYYARKHQTFKGEITAGYMVLYGILRSLVEGLRTDSLYLGPFRISQLLSIVIALVGIYIIYRNKNKSKI